MALLRGRAAVQMGGSINTHPVTVAISQIATPETSSGSELARSAPRPSSVAGLKTMGNAYQGRPDTVDPAATP